MESLNYLHLYYFWIASLERGFLKASRRLRISQSTVSTQIRNLEKQLGCRLIERGPRLYELTEEGRMTFQYCESIFHQGEDLLRSLKKEPTRKPKVRVGFESRLSKDFQKILLGTLMNKGGLTFQVEQGAGDELVRRLAGRQLDVVFCNTRPSQNADRRIRIHPVASSSGVLVGKSQWRRKKGRNFHELDQIPLFLPPEGEGLRSAFNVWMSGKKTGAPQIVLESDDQSLLKNFALSGSGLALLPKFAVSGELTAGQLHVLHEFRETQEICFAVSTGDQESLLKPLTSK